jgi:competence protein ComEA
VPVDAEASIVGRSVINPPAEAVGDNHASEPPAEQSRSALWLRRADQWIVGLLVTTLLVLLTLQWARMSRWGSTPVELTSQKPREYHYSLDINKASWVEWAQLEGIGEKLARRIVDDRNERGQFRNPIEVGRVRGIGPKLLEKLLPFLHGGTEQPAESSSSGIHR